MPGRSVSSDTVNATNRQAPCPLTSASRCRRPPPLPDSVPPSGASARPRTATKVRELNGRGGGAVDEGPAEVARAVRGGTAAAIRTGRSLAVGRRAARRENEGTQIRIERPDRPPDTPGRVVRDARRDLVMMVTVIRQRGPKRDREPSPPWSSVARKAIWRRRRSAAILQAPRSCRASQEESTDRTHDTWLAELGHRANRAGTRSGSSRFESRPASEIDWQENRR